jgi:ribonuclease HI
MELGITTTYVAEMWGVYEGLKLARSKSISNLIVQVDSAVVVHGIESGKQGSSFVWNIMGIIRHLLSLDWNVRIMHIYREANRYADMLANVGCDENVDFLDFQAAPRPPPQLS